MADELQELRDRQQLSDLVNGYARAVDARDWTALRAVFADRIEADFRDFAGREIFRGSAEDWVATIRATVGGMDATQHLMANHLHDIEGDDARVHSDVIAAHFLAAARGEREYTVGGHYDWQFARQPAGWRCVGYRLSVSWTRGNREILRLATRSGTSDTA